MANAGTMGLRLKPLSDTPRAASPASAVSETAALAARARRAWAALDRAEIDACLRACDELAAPHEPYRGRKLLLEAALAETCRADARRLESLYIQMCRVALDVLAREPREPVLLNYAGIPFYELGARDTAAALFAAAVRLDPNHADAQRNLAAARRRRGRVRVSAAARATCARLDGRARELAAAARPAEGLRISLCMIVKDEEEMLPRCLAAVRPAVDEIVVVDTGSSDRSREIARDFGARVIDFPWNGSFADARNVSVEAATGDWILFLDADEVLVEDDVPKLRALAGRVWREAFHLVETSYTGELEHGTAVTHAALRMFRNRPTYRFRGRLHEQFAWALPSGLPERIEQTDVRVEHFGYLGVVRDTRDKARRNIELLQRQAEEREPDSFFEFNLGSEYLAVGDLTAAVRHLERSRELLERDGGARVLQFTPTLYTRLALAHRQLRHFDRAVAVIEEGLALFPDFTDLVFERGWVEQERGRLDEAQRAFERCLEMGEAPARYTSIRGCGSHLARIGLAEVFARRGDFVGAEREALTAIAGGVAHPSAVLFAATMITRNGGGPERVAREVEARVKTTPSVLFLTGVALYEAGHVEAAEERFRRVVELQPRNGRARVALGEALLSLKRWQEAAAVAEAVTDDDPHSPAARRCELFARLVARDSRIDDRLASARSLLPAHEHAAFEGWAALAAGREPGLLAAESAELVTRCLDALARVREIDEFALLVQLLERCVIDARARHEILAGIYLRHGFLDSAAEEWITACERFGPDAEALLGLAQVAYAKGLREDALVFAEAARQRAPTDPRCVRMHERLLAADSASSSHATT